MAICYHASASEIIGGICGGMTSEPDLAVAVEALESVEVAIGHSATYPFRY